MPIFEQTYRKWEGTLKKSRFNWLPITTTGIKQTFKKKRFLLFYVLSFSALVVFIIFIVIRALAPENLRIASDFWMIGPSFFARFLMIQNFVLFIMSIWVGSDLINRDYMTNALQLYLSKPLTPQDYIWGKFSIIAFFILSLLMVPALFLFLLRAIMIPDTSWLMNNAWVILAIIGYSIVCVATYSFIILLLSAVTRNNKFTAVIFFLVFIFTGGVAEAIAEITRIDEVFLISPSDNLINALTVFFGDYSHSISEGLYLRVNPYLSLLVLAVICIYCYRVIRKRVGKIEVI